MVPRIVSGAVWARLKAEPEVVDLVAESLSVLNPGAEYTPAFKAKRWDGYERIYRRQSNEFPAGLTWRVAALVAKSGFGRPEVSWPSPANDPPLAGSLVGFEWRDYQRQAVEWVWRRRRAALQAPTRSGKTEIGIEFVRRAGRRTLWLTHLRTLLEQPPERFRARMPGVRVAAPRGTRETLASAEASVVVATVQTLHKVLQENEGFFEQFGCLVADEAHHAGADTWQDVARACVRADYRLALSGTMATGNPVTDLRIEGAYGPTYTVATTAELARAGFLARPRVVMFEIPRTTFPSYEEVREAVCPTWRSNPRQLSRLGGALFRTAYQRGVVDNAVRNKAVVDTAVAHARAGERFLVLCNKVPHAALLAELIARRVPVSVPVYQLDGESEDEKRRLIVDCFKRTSGAVLVCTPFFREGVDVPQIDAGFLAGGGESSIAVLQAFGRMLTVRPGKTEVLIYDNLDGREPGSEKDYLARHSWGSRLPLYEAQGFSVERRAFG